MQLLTRTEVAGIVKMHPSSIDRLVRQGDFPAPLKLGHAENSSVRWKEDEIVGWLNDRAAQRHIPAKRFA